MDEPTPLDDNCMEERAKGQHDDFDSEISEIEEDSSSDDEGAFVVDQELKDCDAEEVVSTKHIPYDAFLYDFCHVPGSKRKEVVDEEVIREEGLSDMESESEDDESGEGSIKYCTHDPSVSWKKMKPHFGEKFASKEELRYCLTNYAVSNGYPIRITKCSTTRLQAKCGYDKKGIRCTFNLWASWMNQEHSFQIKGFNEAHTCIREYRHAALVNPDWIAKHFLKQLSARPKMKAREMKEEIKKKFLCVVSRGQCYRAKKKALEILNGKLTQHYARIWDYAAEIIRSNPGSTANVGVNVNDDGSTIFLRFYVCFKAVNDGWSRGCRRVIGLDGCFLKGQCKGELLTAIGRDGNNQVYPVAWAVVDVENKANWQWFIELLVDDLKLQDGGGLTIISDQHKGLIEAVKEVLTLVEHRQCARHVYTNFKKTYNGVDYKKMFWGASMATTESGFVAMMEDLKAMNMSAYEHLMARNPHSWSRAFFPDGRACETVENGISESFNSVILEARTKPLLTMLEEIRMYVMERFFRMAKKHLSWNEDVCPAILNKLEGWCEDLRFWTVVASDSQVFEVRLGFDAYQVDLEQGICTCRLWEISGIPCIHACAAMNHTHQQADSFINNYFSKEMFAQTYRGNIRPLNGSGMWPRTTYAKPAPPPARRMPGRPKMRRRRHATEDDDGGYKRLRAVGGTKICTNCYEQGHNKRTCKNPTRPPPPKEKKPMGRPRTREEPRKPKGASTKKKATKSNIPGRSIQKNRRSNQSKASTSTQTKGKEKMDTELQDVPVIQTFKNHATAGDLLQSGYTKDEVLIALQEQEVNVSQVQDDPVLLTPVIQETVRLPAVQAPAVQPPAVQPHAIPPPVVLAPPSKRMKRVRKHSERITELKLGKNKCGKGSSGIDPLELN